MAMTLLKMLTRSTKLKILSTPSVSPTVLVLQMLVTAPPVMHLPYVPYEKFKVENELSLDLLINVRWSRFWADEIYFV